VTDENSFIKIARLRQQAILIRQAAGIRTNGGHGEDRLLLQIAERIEARADELERTLVSPQGRAC